jgi:hypothetical protein
VSEAVSLSRIDIFPIKSLDGVSVNECAITAGGILENDRVYAIVDSEGRYVNGKRTDRIHRLRTSYDSNFERVGLWESGDASAEWFRLGEPSIDGWLSAFFGFPVTLRHEPLQGFPDDPEAFGPTIVTEASLGAVGGWFRDLSFGNVRRRFRTNLELTGGDPFWEDRLFGAPAELLPFRIGSVRFFGHNPCQRCVVPTRDPDRGEALRGFQKSFAALREEHLPEWANAQRFNHFYRFAVNTSIPPSEAGKRLRVGDVVRIDALPEPDETSTEPSGSEPATS